MRCFWMPSFLEQKLAKKKKKSNNGKLFAGAFFGIWFQSFGLPQHVWAALIVNLNPAALWQTGTNWSSWVTERARFPRSKRMGQRLPKYPESPRGAEFIHSEVMRSTPTGSCNPSAQRPATPRCAGEQKGKKETPAYLNWHMYLTFNRTLNTIRSARPQQQTLKTWIKSTFVSNPRLLQKDKIPLNMMDHYRNTVLCLDVLKYIQISFGAGPLLRAANALLTRKYFLQRKIYERKELCIINCFKVTILNYFCKHLQPCF